MSRYSRTRSVRTSSSSRSRSRSTARRSTGSGHSSAGPLVAFLLIASFGILFAGCSSTVVKGPNDGAEEDTTFTAEDVEAFQRSQDAAASGSGKTVIRVSDKGSDLGPVDITMETDSGSFMAQNPSLAQKYASIRMTTSGENSQVYRVTNAFLNVRAEPNTRAASVGRLEQGDPATLVEFTNASWAKVRLADGKEGYVSAAYLSKVVSEDQMKEEEKKYENVYFVNYGFVNVREAADVGSAKLGEIPGQAFVRPVSIEGAWAKVTLDGKQGYVSTQFLQPFKPRLLVRQDQYTLPVLKFDASQTGALDALVQHAQALRQGGMRLMTLRDFYDLLLSQEDRDVRLQSKGVVIGVMGVTPQNVSAVSTALRSNGITATLFLQTKDVGVSGISERTILTLLANGFDIQSGGHTGDDLRTLTSAQLKLELSQSRQLLEEMTHKTVFAVLYPDGGINDRIIQTAANAGYLLGISGVPDKTFGRDQLLRIPSIAVSASMSAEDVVQAAQ